MIVTDEGANPSLPTKTFKGSRKMDKKTEGKKEALVEYKGDLEEILKLKKCIKDKDERLKKQEGKIKKQAGRISRIEERYSKIVWTFIAIGTCFLSGGLLYLMAHIYYALPDSVITTTLESGWISHDIVDALQFFGFYVLCFLAITGLVAWLIFLYWLFKEEE